MTNIRDSVGEIHNYGIDVKNREIYINEFDDSGESGGVDHRMVQNFIKNINVLKNQNKDPITIYLQTIGGCWYAGMGIYDAIKNCKCKTTIIGYSQICSMGTVVLQAATKRLLTPNAMFMCHFGSTNNTGDYQSTQNYSLVDKSNCEKMLRIYAEKCHKSSSFFKEKEYNLSKTKAYIKRKITKGDWYLSAEEAIVYGFADGIMK